MFESADLTIYSFQSPWRFPSTREESQNNFVFVAIQFYRTFSRLSPGLWVDGLKGDAGVLASVFQVKLLSLGSRASWIELAWISFDLLPYDQLLNREWKNVNHTFTPFIYESQDIRKNAVYWGERALDSTQCTLSFILIWWFSASYFTILLWNGVYPLFSFIKK